MGARRHQFVSAFFVLNDQKYYNGLPWQGREGQLDCYSSAHKRWLADVRILMNINGLFVYLTSKLKNEIAFASYTRLALPKNF